MKYQGTTVNDVGGIKKGVFKSKGGPGIDNPGSIPPLMVKKRKKVQKDPSQFVQSTQIPLS